MVGTFSGGGGGAGSAGGVGALPVELVSFSGKAMGKQNLPEWATAFETSTPHHVVERSADGRVFA
jgi:hypothetical protein